MVACSVTTALDPVCPQVPFALPPQQFLYEDSSLCRQAENMMQAWKTGNSRTETGLLHKAAHAQEGSG